MVWMMTAFELYTYMRKSYGQDFIAVPLMMDLTYTNINPFLKTDSENAEKADEDIKNHQ